MFQGTMLCHAFVLLRKITETNVPPLHVCDLYNIYCDFVRIRLSPDMFWSAAKLIRKENKTEIEQVSDMFRGKPICF